MRDIIFYYPDGSTETYKTGQILESGPIVEKIWVSREPGELMARILTSGTSIVFKGIPFKLEEEVRTDYR